jgi:hypothetical protein
MKVLVDFPSGAAGLVVGCVAPLRALLFGDDAPLAFLIDCLNVLGEAMIPCERPGSLVPCCCMKNALSLDMLWAALGGVYRHSRLQYYY